MGAAARLQSALDTARKCYTSRDTYLLREAAVGKPEARRPSARPVLRAREALERTRTDPN